MWSAAGALSVGNCCRRVRPPGPSWEPAAGGKGRIALLRGRGQHSRQQICCRCSWDGVRRPAQCRSSKHSRMHALQAAIRGSLYRYASLDHVASASEPHAAVISRHSRDAKSTYAGKQPARARPTPDNYAATAPTPHGPTCESCVVHLFATSHSLLASHLSYRVGQQRTKKSPLLKWHQSASCCATELQWCRALPKASGYSTL